MCSTFFTTKESGKGTGLGLSMVYGIVKQSGGTIGIESKPGCSTTCTIFFPRVDDVVQDVPDSGGAPVQTQGRENILIVEDEPAVRGLVHETLRASGYQVLVTRHGIEALLAAARHLGPIHLLLVDVVLPQMSGPDVAERLAVLWPGIKVLYMSGYPDHPVFSMGTGTGGAAFLQKPFTMSTLAKKVCEALDGVSAV